MLISVVLAGLIPWLKELKWQVPEPIRPGLTPLANLKGVLDKYFPDPDDEKFLYECINNEASEGLKPLLERFERFPREQKILLVVNQFEELFTVAPPEQRDRFINLITQVSDTQPYTPLDSLCHGSLENTTYERKSETTSTSNKIAAIVRTRFLGNLASKLGFIFLRTCLKRLS